LLRHRRQTDIRRGCRGGAGGQVVAQMPRRLAKSEKEPAALVRTNALRTLPFDVSTTHGVPARARLPDNLKRECEQGGFAQSDVVFMSKTKSIRRFRRFPQIK